MGIALFGPNRMVNWQAANRSWANRDLTETKPEWGLGPTGMPGSSDYLADAESRARGDKGPNAFEQLGLYWNGSGVSQGRPLRDIQLNQGIVLRQMALAENEKAQRAADQQTHFGLMGNQQDIDVTRIASDSGLGLIAADNAARRTAIEERLANAHALNTVGGLVPGTGQDYAAGVVGLDRPPAGGLVDWQQRRADAQQANADTRAAREQDLAALAGKRVDAANARAMDKESILPEDLVKDPVLLASVRSIMQVDPKAADADAQYELMAKRLNLPGWSNWNGTVRNAALAKNLLGMYGEAVKADDARRARFAAGGVAGVAEGGGDVSRRGAEAQSGGSGGGLVQAPVAQPNPAPTVATGTDQVASGVDDRLVEAYFNKYGGRIPRETIREKLGQMGGGK